MSAKRLNLSPTDAALLDEVDEALASGRAVTPSSSLWLAIASASPRAEDVFRLRLRSQLTAAAGARPASDTGWLGALRRQLAVLARQARLVIAAAVLALLVLPVGIAAAQGGLANVLPVFIRQPIEGLVLVKTPLTKVASDAELQRLASFPLWIPSDAGCAGPNQRTFDAASHSVTLVYQCVSVSERSADTTFRPVVDAGTLEEVSINGLTGYYYQSTHVMPTTGQPQTTHALVFEREGTTVTLSPLPDFSSSSAAGAELGKADLVRIASSMQRVATP